MKKFLFAAALAALVPTVASAQQCGKDYKAQAEHLAKEFGEAPVAAGVMEDGSAVVEVFAKEDGSTWTLLVVKPDGSFCLGTTGLGWQAIPFKLPEPAGKQS